MGFGLPSPKCCTALRLLILNLILGAPLGGGVGVWQLLVPPGLERTLSTFTPPAVAHHHINIHLCYFNL